MFAFLKPLGLFFSWHESGVNVSQPSMGYFYILVKPLYAKKIFSSAKFGTHLRTGENIFRK